MTIDIDAIRAREGNTTPGPWVTGDQHPGLDGLDAWEVVISDNLPLIELSDGLAGEANARFIAHAREDIPALLTEVDRYADLLTAARAVIAAGHLDWDDDNHDKDAAQGQALTALADAVRALDGETPNWCGAIGTGWPNGTDAGPVHTTPCRLTPDHEEPHDWAQREAAEEAAKEATR